MDRLISGWADTVSQPTRQIKKKEWRLFYWLKNGNPDSWSLNTGMAANSCPEHWMSRVWPDSYIIVCSSVAVVSMTDWTTVSSHTVPHTQIHTLDWLILLQTNCKVINLLQTNKMLVNCVEKKVGCSVHVSMTHAFQVRWVLSKWYVMVNYIKLQENLWFQNHLF